jgi:hypothetical protein
MSQGLTKALANEPMGSLRDKSRHPDNRGAFYSSAAGGKLSVCSVINRLSFA